MPRLHFRFLGWITLAVAGSVATAADPITVSPQTPASSPWDLAALSDPPAVEWLDAATSSVRSLRFAGEPYRGEPTQVFAYYATPASLQGDAVSAKPWPAVVLVHGGGGTAFREWVELWAGRGYAAIAMDLAGYRPQEGKNPHRREHRERLAQAGPDQGDHEKFGRIDRAVDEQWPYHAVANVIRAHSLVRSFPEVDASRTAITGISWGGYLTCIVAGLDDRFQAAVPVYGCGYLHENSAWRDRLAGMPPASRARWIRLWDPSRYLPAATMPMLFINGTNDFAYPLDSYMRSFAAVPGEKQLRITVNMPHGHPPGWAPREIGLFVDHHLRGTAALPSVGDPRRNAGEGVRLPVTAPLGLQQATLHFTTDVGAINQRTWQARTARLEEAAVVVEAPPAAATAWFVTVEDRRGAIVSSRVVFAPAPQDTQSSPAAGVESAR